MLVSGKMTAKHSGAKACELSITLVFIKLADLCRGRPGTVGTEVHLKHLK